MKPVSLWQVAVGLRSLASRLVISMLFIKPGWAGLSTYTPLDEVQGWRIERKQGREGRLHCRGSLPSGASWFSGNIHLDPDGQLVEPEGLAFAGDQKEIDAVKAALERCRQDLLYLP